MDEKSEAKPKTALDKNYQYLADCFNPMRIKTTGGTE